MNNRKTISELESRIANGGKLKFHIINPTSKYWKVDKGKKPGLATKVFRFSMLTSLYVAASVPDYVEVRIIDEDVEPIDFDTDADVIGISFMSFCAPRAYEIADKFRKEKGKTVIMGGYHPSFMPEEAIRHADSICIGEAENKLPGMFDDFMKGKLKPFYRGELADLKKLPALNRNLIKKTFYIVPDMVQLTRGCHHKCSFCSITAFFNNQFRKRPVEDAINELKGLGKNILFMDDNLTNDREYAKKLFTRMIPLKKTWNSQVGIDFAFDDELMDLAKKAGCRGVFIGFESLSQKNLKNNRKNFNLNRDYTQAVKNLHGRRIPVFAGVMLGMDDDTTAVFQETLDFLIQNNIDMLQVTISTPFPGTPLYSDLKKQGRIVTYDWNMYDFSHVVFKPQNMDEETLWYGFSWVMKEFYSWKNILRRIFNQIGYLPFWTGIRYSIVLSLAYRTRFKTKGVFERAKLFNPQYINLKN
jgi:radical SAM superfamily enzyme YgiQ (UPF0313 family)